MLKPKKATLVLTLRVKYDLNQTTIGYLKERLYYIAHHAADEGMMSGDSDAEVASWEANIKEAECKKYGSPLKDNGRCPDATCPYSDRSQDAKFTEG